MFRTIVTKFPGTCKRCREPIYPGDKIRYGGIGLTYHLKKDCPAGIDKNQLSFRKEFRQA